MGKCGDCRFGEGFEADTWANMGKCHRYPPKTGDHPRGGFVAVWPPVARHDWCGEFVPAPPAGGES